MAHQGQRRSRGARLLRGEPRTQPTASLSVKTLLRTSHWTLMLLGAAPLEQRPPVKVSLVMYTLVYPHEHPAAFVTGHIFEAEMPVEVSGVFVDRVDGNEPPATCRLAVAACSIAATSRSRPNPCPCRQQWQAALTEPSLCSRQEARSSARSFERRSSRTATSRRSRARSASTFPSSVFARRSSR